MKNISCSWLIPAFATILLTSCSYVDKLKFWDKGEDLTQPPTPLTEITPTVHLQQKWKEKAGSGNNELYVRLIPEIVGNRIFIVDASGDLYALNKKTGERIWETEIEQPATGGVGVLGADLLLVGTAEGEVFAYHQDDGSVVWHTQLSSEILSAPSGAGEHIIAYAADNTVYGLTAEDGKIDWQVNNPMPALVLRGGSMPLMMGDQVAYVGLSNGRVLALSTDSGRRLWERAVSTPRGRSELHRMVDISGKMALVDDTLYVVTYQGHAAALSVATGREIWQRNMSSYTGVSANEKYVTLSDADDNVWLLSAKDGVTLWKQDTMTYRVLTAPVFWEEFLVVGDKEGYLHVLAPEDGSIIGRVHVDNSGISVPPVIADNVLYVLANNGRIASYTLSRVQESSR